MTRIASIATLVVLLAAPALAAGPSVPTLSPNQLQPGQKAVVRTVFAGERIETFDAEIVGVLRGGRAEGDLILAKATSERVVKSGVAQGMSGSPVYVDGKLIGALSTGWSFSREPLFGITPIGEMLRVLDLPPVDPHLGTAGPSGVDLPLREPRVRFGELAWDDDARLAPGAENPVPLAGTGLTGGPAPLRLPLACGGLNPGAFEIAQRLFAPLGLAAVPGGRAVATHTTRENIEPGAAVAVDVLRGDLQLAAIGTLTYRDGDRVLIFGHPLFQSGDVLLPLSTASIATVVASELSSFKLGSPGRPIGVLTQDRRTAMGGRLGTPPELMPLAVTVGGPGRRAQAFHFESIEDRALAPQLVAVAALNSVLESGGVGTNQTLWWTLKLDQGAHSLELHDVVVGESPTSDLAGGIAAPLRFLYGNPFGRLAFDSVRVTIDVEPGREQWTLRAARLLDATVRPGQRIRVACDLERWRGGRETRVLSLTVPEEVPDGRYALVLGGGPELSRYESQRLPGRYRPTSLDDAWRRMASFRPSDALYGALYARAPEVTRDGRDYPELPNSALPLLSSSQVAGESSRRGDRAILDEVREPLKGQVRGEAILEVNVDAKAP